jgi:hypothetical protein
MYESTGRRSMFCCCNPRKFCQQFISSNNFLFFHFVFLHLCNFWGIPVVVVFSFLFLFKFWTCIVKLAWADLQKPYSHDSSRPIFLWVYRNVWVAPLESGVIGAKWNWNKLAKRRRKTRIHRGKGDSIEILPILWHANLGDRVIHLNASDGMEEMISHDGCQVSAMTQDPSKSGEWGLGFIFSVFPHMFDSLCFHVKIFCFPCYLSEAQFGFGRRHKLTICVWMMGF